MYKKKLLKSVIKGWFDRIVFIALLYWQAPLGVLILFATIFISYYFGNNTDFFTLGNITLYIFRVFSIVLIIYNLVQFLQIRKKLRLIPIKTRISELIKDVKLPNDWECIEYYDGPAIYCEKLNNLLDSSNNCIALLPLKYAISKIVKPYSAFILSEKAKSWRTTNDKKIRIASNIDYTTIKLSEKLALQKTSYFEGVVTNESGRMVLISSGGDRGVSADEVIFNGPDLFINAQLKKIISLEESQASNHIGISTVLITNDRRVVYQRQGVQLIDAGHLAPSASGSADWDDICDSQKELRFSSKTMQNIVKYAMERELFEEIAADSAIYRTETYLTGFARYLHRGGKPEFFGITLMDINSDKLYIRREERRYVDIIIRDDMVQTLFKENVMDVINGLIDLYDINKSHNVSLSFYATLKFASSYLSNEKKDVVSNFFNG
jgi:hypothetical protein